MRHYVYSFNGPGGHSRSVASCLRVRSISRIVPRMSHRGSGFSSATRARHVLHVPERPVKGSAVRQCEVSSLYASSTNSCSHKYPHVPFSFAAFSSLLFLYPEKPATLRVSGPSSSERRFSSQELCVVCNI